jgi:dethiobiotin synthetase
VKSLFITGTDTEVGKTFFTASAVRALRAGGTPALGLKPVAAGDRHDAEQLAQANGETLSLNEINPVFVSAPIAPYTHSVLEDRPLDLEPFWQTWQDLQNNHEGPFLVEGAGGWLVPLTRDYWIRDLARELGFPVVVVARAALGTLNHALLTVESIRAAKLEVAGIVLNYHDCDPDDLATQTNAPILEELAGCPVMKLESGENLESLPKWITGD